MGMSYARTESLKPEQKARLIIDRWLEDAGWEVVSRSEYSEARAAQAVKENILKGNLEADYALYLNGKIIGLLEAKRKEDRLGDNVDIQVENYSKQLIDNKYQTWINPIPFVFKSNGDCLLFRDLRDPDSDYEDLNRKMLTPKELFEKSGLEDEYARLPAVLGVGKGKLRQCQHDAIQNIELSFKRGIKRCLLDLATGSGKTFTACMLAYRSLTYTPVQRILYLVDRNNLGKQTFDEFNSFKLTESGDSISSIYDVGRLKKVEQAINQNISICTIQRLFAVLSGQNFTDADDSKDDENEDSSFFTEEDQNDNQVIELKGDIKIPHDNFDLIIIDECHRSIYGKWRKVLEYFDTAKIVGLTATPSSQTFAFFNCVDQYGNYNPTMQYSIEDSYVDGVNVPPVIYRIKTFVSENGGQIDSGDKVLEVNRRTGKKELVKQDSTEKYSKEDLDRSVVNPAQIKTVIHNFREVVYDTLFQDREKSWNYLPKTLIFAKSEQHASLIVDAVKEEFAPLFPNNELPEKFVQKITYSQPNPNQRIKDFRYDKEFRVAVTVTLVATGTDVKPLEIVFFMRDIHSSILYTQMKGRGCRYISDDELKNVTPNANRKVNYFLIDAVDVTESEKTFPELIDSGSNTKRKSLELVLEWMSHGEVSNDNLEYLAEKLSTITNRISAKHQQDFYDLTHVKMSELASNIFEKLGDPNFPPYLDIQDKNNERKLLVSALIDNPKARELLLQFYEGYFKVIQSAQDFVTYSGFSVQDAESNVKLFKEYVTEHRDELEALRIIYNDEDKCITSAMLEDLSEKLINLSPNFRDFSVIWSSYNTLSSNNKIKKKVLPLSTQSEKDALTNLIELVRFVFGKSEELRPINGKLAKRFNLYIGQHLGIDKREFSDDQIKVLQQLANYVLQRGCVQRLDFHNDGENQLFIKVVNIYSNDKLDEELNYFSKFLLGINKAA